MTDDNIWTEKDLADDMRADPETTQDADPAVDLDADLQKLQEERDRLFQQLARVTADFRNTQRRLEQDKAQSIQYANSHLIKSILPILDNFERALEMDVTKTDPATLKKGMQIV